jgi:hypothetical protein
MFRELFLHYLDKAFARGELNFFSAHRHLHEPAALRRHLAPVHTTKWVVFAKRPFAGPAQVLDYVGRYTHRVAICNNRLASMDDGKIRFCWKDYRNDNRQKTMTLPAEEFTRRFLIHELPDGFHGIRYTASSATAIAPGSWPDAGNCWGWRWPDRHLIRLLTTAIVSGR